MPIESVTTPSVVFMNFSMTNYDELSKYYKRLTSPILSSTLLFVKVVGTKGFNRALMVMIILLRIQDVNLTRNINSFK